MTLFRPCIDLHEGKVKQIVGSSLSDSGSNLQTNFESEYSAAYFAELYKKDELFGGHVIMLGKGNEIEAKSALAAHPQGLQIGGGISPKNAEEYLNAGASHVIVTSYLFENGEFSEKRFITEIVKSISSLSNGDFTSNIILNFIDWAIDNSSSNACKIFSLCFFK